MVMSFMGTVREEQSPEEFVADYVLAARQSLETGAKILETKIAMSKSMDYLKTHSVLSLTETQKHDSAVRAQLTLQLRERWRLGRRLRAQRYDQAIVLPCPLLRRTDSHDPTAWVRQLDWSTLPAEKPRLLLAHGSVHGFGATDLDTHLDADEENPASATNQLRLDAPLLEQLDYVALGDWHGLKQVNARSWYSGTPEPDRFPRTDDYQGGQVLAVTAQRGELPVVQPRPTASLNWLPLRVELQSSADVERLERQLEQLLGDEPGQQLLLLEEQGSLSLEGHRRYDALLERWEAQLLRLKRRGRCGTSPDAQELADLCGRVDDPLIARVALDLQQELSASTNPEGTAVLQLALAELHRCLQAERCA